jgi:hypothetical protein
MPKDCDTENLYFIILGSIMLIMGSQVSQRAYSSDKYTNFWWNVIVGLTDRKSRVFEPPQRE